MIETVLQVYRDNPPLLMIFAGLLGMAAGSFLCVVADRVPKGRSIIRPPSSCDRCGKRLQAIDLIPVLGYVLLRGRCRHCRAFVPPLYPAMEMATGAIFALLAGQIGLTPELPVVFVFVSILIVITITDIRERIIPNKVILFGVAAIPILRLYSHPLPLWNYAAAFAIGGGLLYLIAYVSWIVLRKEGMGGGDIKLFAWLGLTLGIGPTVLTLFLASLFGLLSSLPNLLRPGKSTLDRSIAFGPYIALAAMIAYLWGDVLIDWYLTLILL